MNIINWLMDHSEIHYVTLAANGYDSYYPEYEEYLYKNEVEHFTKQITLVIMILLSKYSAEIWLTDDENNVLKSISEKELEEISTAIHDSLSSRKFGLDILFTDENNNQFVVDISEGLSVLFVNLPQNTQEYVEKLVNKVGLSLQLDNDVYGD